MASAAGIRMGKVFVEIGGDASKLFRTLSTLNKRIGQAGAQMRNVGSRMAGVGIALAAPVALATRQFASFDDAIRATAAVSGATGQQLQMLTDTARHLGATTSFTAGEVASLMTELGRAGFKPDEINAMTGAVLNLARATGTDATLASGIMAATLRQFSLGAGDAARAADVLTLAANSTFNTVEGLGESLKYAGPVAKSLGMSLEDTTAILGVLGNVGIQGSEAGTALRRLSVIAAGSGEDLQRIFGISNTDAAGQLKPLVQVLDEINTVTAGMPVAERTAKMAEAFGLLGITSANVLADSAGGVAALAAKLQGAQGTAAKTATFMDSGLGGSFRILLSAVEGVALAIGDALAPTIKSMADGFTQAAGMVTKFIKDNESLVVTVAGVVAGVIAAGVAIWGLGAALSAVSAIGGVVLAVIGALASPIGLVVAGVAALSAGALYAVGAFDGLAANFSGTLSGIYDAITAGDLSMAFEILWAGLHLSWLQGVATFMGFVDPWISMFQNAFTYLGTEIAVIWDRMTTYLASTQWGAALIGVFDNVINQILWNWDQMESALRKSWNFVQSFFRTGFDLTAENNKVDSEMAARAQARSVARPGVTERMRQAREEGDRMRAEGEQRVGAMRQAADETMQGREDANRERAAERAAGVAEAQQRLDELRGRAAEAAAATQVKKEEEMKALQGVQEAARPGPARAPEPEAAGAGEVVGTFSALAAAGLGFGSTLDQQMVDELKRVNRNLETMEGGVIAE